MPASSSNSLLPALARATISERLGVAAEFPEIVPDWRKPGATFVTLTSAGALRGCIGSLRAWRPLVEDIRANAVAAAFEDPRFPPLTQQELATVEIEVSLLGPPEALPPLDAAGLAATLQPGVDGVIVRDDTGRQATFLPQVWEQLPDVGDFLAQLKLKAGMDPRCDDRLLHYARYRVEKFRE